MLSFTKENNGKPVGLIKPKKNNDIIFMNPNNDDGYDNIKLKNNEKLIPLPDPFNRQIVYIAGPEGSGKSFYASQYIKNYKDIFPNNLVYVFSRLDEDQVIDNLDIERIPLNENLGEVDIIKDIDNCLVLFDDIDTISDKGIKEKVYKILNDILEVGRHNNIYIIITSHLINGNDKKMCRSLLNSSHTVTFFPKSGSNYGINYLLKNYISLSKDQIEKIMNLPSRWVTINKKYPMHVFYEKGAYTLN